MLRKIRAQNTLEYIVILTAIVLAVVAGRTLIQQAVNRNMNETAQSINRAVANRLP